jgi:hypothetical protein
MERMTEELQLPSPGVLRYFSHLQDVQSSSAANLVSYLMGTMSSLPGVQQWGVKLTSHLHLLLRWIMGGAVPLLPKCIHNMHRGNFMPYLSHRKELNKIIMSLFSWKALEGNRHHEADSGATLYRQWSTTHITWPLLSKHKQFFPLICQSLTISYRLTALGTWQEITSVK